MHLFNHPKGRVSRKLPSLSPNLCAFASLADVAKGGDRAKSALREIFSSAGICYLLSGRASGESSQLT
jgi:hypothetical protein